MRHFNPRHPYGWRPGRNKKLTKKAKFQSTPPIRVATPLYTLGFHSNRISIHATHTGGDDFGKRFVTSSMISIHATHTGGDSGHTSVSPPCLHFNPRHPYGWRLPSFCQQHSVAEFQSTPPIRVATLVRARTFYCQRNFNPRHPYGWRHARVCLRRRRLVFQSTPPIRVATWQIRSILPPNFRFQSTPPIRVATRG